jgi:hypothetical protein
VQRKSVPVGRVLSKYKATDVQRSHNLLPVPPTDSNLNDDKKQNDDPPDPVLGTQDADLVHFDAQVSTVWGTCVVHIGLLAATA